MKILKQLSEAMGVSGAESEVRKVIVDLIEPHVDEIHTDTMGNVLALKKGTKPSWRMKVLIDAHMDEVGFMVTGHNSDGMLKVTSIGGLDDRILLGTRVLVGEDRIPGLIGAKPVHLLSSSEREKVVSLDKMLVDIGVDKKATAERKAPIGTRIGFDSEFMDLGRVARGKAFDDRAGCSVLVHLLQGERFRHDIWAAFVVQEEVGLRGAQVAAHRVGPDAAFVLDATTADDQPSTNEEDEFAPVTRLGAGPAIYTMDGRTLYDRRLVQHLTDTAETEGIPWQYRKPGRSGTDAGGIQTQLEGIPTAAISLPARYIHSPAAIISKKDYQNMIKMLRGALARLELDVLKR